MTLPYKKRRGKYYNPKKILSSKRDLRLTERYLENLFYEINSKTTETEVKECPICYCEMNQYKNMCITPCEHMFCFTCIMLWTRTKNTCPVCRFNLVQNLHTENDTSLTDESLNRSFGSTINEIQELTMEALERERIASELAENVIENAISSIDRRTVIRRIMFDDL